MTFESRIDRNVVVEELADRLARVCDGPVLDWEDIPYEVWLQLRESQTRHESCKDAG